MEPRENSEFGYANPHDTATAGMDHAAASGMLTAADDTEKTIKMTPDNLSAARVANGEVTATIEIDEETPILTITDAAAAKGDTGEARAHLKARCRSAQRWREPDGSPFREKAGSG